MKTIKILFRNTALTAVIIMMILTFTGARYYGAYSTEGGGLGCETSEEAAYLQELFDSGLSSDETDILLYEWDIAHGIDVLPPPGYTGSTEPISDVSTPSQVQPQATSESPKKAEAKVYSHDFETITDEARENFIHFSKDGVPESMYLNISSESIDNALTGKEINATTAGNETGTVNFIDNEKNTVYSWIFEAGKWTSDDEFSLDLTSKVEDYDVDEFKASKISVQDMSLPTGNEVALKVAVSYDDGTEIGLYTLDAEGKYNKVDTVVVEDGFITITYKDELVSYIISSDDLTALNQEEVVEETPEPEQTEKVSEPAEVVEEVAEPVSEETSAEVVEENKPFPIAAIIIYVVVLLAGAAGVIAYRRRK